MKNSLQQKIILLGQSLTNDGTGFCYVSILNDNITLDNFCEFTDSSESKFWAKVQRVSLNLEPGLGK